MKEIVIIMGIQASGKSTLVDKYRYDGYKRFNRDTIGGSLEELNIQLENSIKDGGDKFVLDNTYGTKKSRALVIDIAKKYGFKIKCIWKATKIEDAQFNASSRIIKKYVFGKSKIDNVTINEILGPNGQRFIKGAEMIPAIAQYAYKKSFEEPKVAEGFDIVEKVVFKREKDDHYKNKAIFLDYDGTLRDTISGDKYPKSVDDIKLLPNRKKVLERYEKDGYILLGVSNQSGVEKGEISDRDVNLMFKMTNSLLGFDIDYRYCPHHSFPIRCYCRKPLPGLPVYFIEKYKLDASKCIFVGDSKSDETCAKRCGIQFQWAEDFFK